MKAYCSKNIIYVILFTFFGLIIIINLLKTINVSSLYIGGRHQVAPFRVSENFQNEDEEGFDVATNKKEVNIATSPGSF